MVTPKSTFLGSPGKVLFQGSPGYLEDTLKLDLWIKTHLLSLNLLTLLCYLFRLCVLLCQLESWDILFLF